MVPDTTGRISNCFPKRGMSRWFLASLLASLLPFAAWSAWADGLDGAKFHAGHYVALPRYDDGPSAMRDALRPGVQGIHKRYTWRELEPRPGEYDFSGVARDLALLSESGRQLVVLVCDKSFKNERSTPRYLWEEHTLPVNSQATGTGYVSKRWDPYVVERFGKLMAAMGQAFDSHPHLEGVGIQETALGIGDPVLEAQGYSAERYRDALIRQLNDAADAFPRSRIFWYANFLPGNQSYLQEVAQAVPRVVAIGGPDVLPENFALQRHFYPTLRALQGAAVTFSSMQFASFRHEREGAGGKYWTHLELFTFARDDLGVNYLFWERVKWPKPKDSFTIEDAYPVIAAHPLRPKPVAR